MTVKELITALLEMPMDNEVKLQIEKDHIDEYGEKCSGWLFCIDEIEKDGYQTYINFTDWRDDKKVDDVLDKIRAEIQKLRNCSCSCSDGIIDDVEEILDKYKAEGSDKE